ncbi:carbonic anhydrase [Rarobacter faecitabidus]|nr:carbonic anhydrase [Rarobacter faecitabidus]
MTPAEAWLSLKEGNARFMSGNADHPSQDVARRHELAAAQAPFAVIFGCSDSRVAAEIIFDRGLGDVFVVRTAGHVLDTTVIGSIEYGVDLLGASLIVVLAHDHCGAIAAAHHTLTTGENAKGFVRAVVDRVLPSIVTTGGDGHDPKFAIDPVELGREHVKHTVDMLYGYSATIAKAVDEGRCAIVGVEYELHDGRASLLESLGQL